MLSFVFSTPVSCFASSALFPLMNKIAITSPAPKFSLLWRKFAVSVSHPQLFVFSFFVHMSSK